MSRGVRKDDRRNTEAIDMVCRVRMARGLYQMGIDREDCKLGNAPCYHVCAAVCSLFGARPGNMGAIRPIGLHRLDFAQSVIV